MGEFFVVIYSMVFLFRSAHVVTLATHFPSVRTGEMGRWGSVTARL